MNSRNCPNLAISWEVSLDLCLANIFEGGFNSWSIIAVPAVDVSRMSYEWHFSPSFCTQGANHWWISAVIISSQTYIVVWLPQVRVQCSLSEQNSLLCSVLFLSPCLLPPLNSFVSSGVFRFCISLLLQTQWTWWCTAFCVSLSCANEVWLLSCLHNVFETSSEYLKVL